MYYTEGKFFHKGIKFQSFYTDKNAFDNTPDRYRVILIESGNLVIKINDEKKAVISPAVILLNEKDIIEIVEHDIMTYHGLYFNPKILNKELTIDNINNPEIKAGFNDTIIQDYGFLFVFSKQNNDDKIFNIINFDSLKRMKSLFFSIKEELDVQKDDWWTCSTRCYIIQLLFLLYQLSKQQQNTPAAVIEKSDGLTDKILTYLNANYYEKITIDGLAKRFNTNRTTINLDFKKQTDKTVMNYLIDLRIKIASSMLHSTDVTVNEIMFRVGFNDLSHFGRHFKKLNGISPREYKEKYSWLFNYAKKIV